MPRYRLTWTETLTATIRAESESAARQVWIDGLEGESEPTDNRHDYDLEIEELDRA